MLNKITRYIVGTVKVSLSGENAARFFNLCARRGITLWGYNRVNEQYKFEIKQRDFKRVWQIKRQCRVRLKITKKNGLPFATKPLKKRPGLIVGAVAAVVLYIFMSNQLWLLTVSGSGRYTKAEILNAAQEAGVKLGVPMNSFDEGLAAIEIMQKLPELEWVSVNTWGSSAEIAVKQTIRKPELEEKEKVQNLVAAKTGLVEKITAQQGMPMVKVGEAVKKGDLLITGVWDSNQRKEEWLKTDIVDIFTANSRGVVMAQVKENIKVYLPLKEKLYESGKSYKRYTAEFFGLKLPFVPKLVPSGNYKLSTKKESLWLLGKELPIGFNIQQLTRQKEVEKVIGEQEAKQRLEKQIKKELEKILGEQGKIISSEKPIFTKGKKGYVMSQTYLCSENIAVPHKVVLK